MLHRQPYHMSFAACAGEVNKFKYCTATCYIFAYAICAYESRCSSVWPTSDLCELGLRCKFCAVVAQQTTNTMAVLISCIFGCVCVTVWVRSLFALLRVFLRTPLSGLCTYELIRRRPCARCPCIIFWHAFNSWLDGPRS